jgi:hypothetical protein
MKVEQLFTLVNTTTQEVLGETGVVLEDLSNVVDIGKEIINTDNVDNYVKKLVNHIGKVVFVNRLYAGGVPSVLMDSWEYGSILEKVTAEMPNATENESWKLENGVDYSPDVFYQPVVEAKFFNSKVTFEIPLSFTELQVKESFSSKEQLNGFISMLTTSVENAMTVKLDALIMRTINHMVAETVSVELDDGTSTGTLDFTGSTVKAVNLMAGFNANQTASKKVTIDTALSNPEFIRYATYTIGLYSDRMSKISTLFNSGGKARFTPKDMQHIVLLSDFAKGAETFLSADLQNKDMVTLPKHDSVPYWQGSGLDYSFSEISKINVKTSSAKTVSMTGLIGVMFDRDALGVTNLDRRVTTNYNPKAEFYTNFYKFDAGYYNDLNENFVVFYLG